MLVLDIYTNALFGVVHIYVYYIHFVRKVALGRPTDLTIKMCFTMIIEGKRRDLKS